ncbi:MAG: biopolymer transporter ExbD [Myxococcales bacterium]|nr:biopolymer transporter ExbD [Myxococcales bacterium]
MALGKLPEDEVAGEGAIFAEINITPLTDIFLVLLVIFMVSSSVAVERAETSSRQGVKVNLPKGTNKEIDPAARSLVVSVTSGNLILVKGQPVAAADLDGAFRSAFASDPGTQVIIEADEGVKHGVVVGIMERAKQAGLARLAIATKGGQ